MGSVSFIPMEVSRQMRSREKPLWIGKPIAAKFALQESWPTFLIGVAWTAASVYWLFWAVVSGNMITVAIGAPLVAIGLYQLTAPIRVYRRARRTTYVVSNQRLIILHEPAGTTMESFAPTELGSLNIDTADDGSGSVIFQESRSWRPQGGVFFSKIGFKSIPRVGEAVDHILALKGQVKREDASGDRSQGSIENYRGYEIEHEGDRCCVGDDTFVDLASAKAHIDANWARSGQ